MANVFSKTLIKMLNAGNPPEASLGFSTKSIDCVEVDYLFLEEEIRKTDRDTDDMHTRLQSMRINW